MPQQLSKIKILIEEIKTLSEQCGQLTFLAILLIVKIGNKKSENTACKNKLGNLPLYLLFSYI